MKNVMIAILLAGAFALAGAAYCQEAPKAAEKPSPLGYTDTPMQPNGKWHVHDINRPHPAIVTPGEKACQSPSDAIVLFDGKDMSNWTDKKGNPSKWVIKDDYMECVPKAGYIFTKQTFGDVQLHLEFAAPTPPKGNSQGRGNSGLFFFGDSGYEVQVLDSYDNVTYADGQCGAVYGQTPPLANASRKPGEWQSYDVIFRAPVFEGDKLVKPAYITLFQNGVLMQDHTEVLGNTGHKILAKYRPMPAKGPIAFQDHGNPVRYRNIWVREIKAAAE